MPHVALFHSVLGLRTHSVDAATRMRAADHDPIVVDLYDGRTFDDYDEASTFADEIGDAELRRRALAGVAHLPDGFIAMGFSTGAGIAEYVATQRSVGRVVLLSGASPLSQLGVDAWPAALPAQIHHMADDPRCPKDAVDAVAAAVRAAEADVEVFAYPGDGHLFTDPSLPDEYDGEACANMWRRVRNFCSGVPST